MKTFYAIFIYIVIINVCVVARGGFHGGGHSGGHAGGRFRRFGASRGSQSSHGYHGYHGYHYVSASHAGYTYHPPSHISYICRYCNGPASYPVYRHPLPSYVYVYKDSGSRYNQLLTGLALYNLGRSAGAGHSSNSINTKYAARQEESCSLQIIERSHFEETKFPCFMISSFIQSSPNNTTRTIDITSPQFNVKPDLNITGDPIEVTYSQECVLWHNLSMHKERNHVPCALLKEYANTVKPDGVPVYIWLPTTVLACVIIIYLSCQCFSRKKKESVKEEAPLNHLHVVGYCANY